jgi:hypothetical protein
MRKREIDREKGRKEATRLPDDDVDGAACAFEM